MLGRRSRADGCDVCTTLHVRVRARTATDFEAVDLGRGVAWAISVPSELASLEALYSETARGLFAIGDGIVVDRFFRRLQALRRSFSRTLFAAGTPARSWLDDAKARKRGTLLVEATDARSDALPWESLEHRGRSLASDRLGVVRWRTRESGSRATPWPIDRPLRVLLIAPRPATTAHLPPTNIAALTASIVNPVRSIEIVRCIPPTCEEFAAVVARRDFDLVHFDGHSVPAVGSANDAHGGSADTADACRNALAFEDARGGLDLVDAARLRAAVGDTPLVVIDACSSADIARALVDDGVPWALGVGTTLRVSTASTFSMGFYLGLARGGSPFDALATGRLELSRRVLAMSDGGRTTPIPVIESFLPRAFASSGFTDGQQPSRRRAARCSWEAPTADAGASLEHLSDIDDALDEMLRATQDERVFEPIHLLTAEDAMGLAQHVDGDRGAARALYRGLRAFVQAERPFDRVLDDAPRILLAAGGEPAQSAARDAATFAREITIAVLSRRAQAVASLLGPRAYEAIDVWRTGRSEELGEALIAALRVVDRCAEAAWLERTLERVADQNEHTRSPITMLLRATRLRARDCAEEAEALASDAVSAIDGDADPQLFAFALVEHMLARSAQGRLVRGHPLLGAWEADDARSFLAEARGGPAPLRAAILRNIAEHDLNAHRFDEALASLDEAAAVLRDVHYAADVAADVQTMRARALLAIDRTHAAHEAIAAADALSILSVVQTPAALFHRGAVQREIGNVSRALSLLTAAYDGARRARDVITMRSAAESAARVLHAVGVERGVLDIAPIIAVEVERW